MEGERPVIIDINVVATSVGVGVPLLPTVVGVIITVFVVGLLVYVYKVSRWTDWLALVSVNLFKQCTYIVLFHEIIGVELFSQKIYNIPQFEFSINHVTK